MNDVVSIAGALPRPSAFPLVGALPTMLRKQFAALDRWQEDLGDVVEVPFGLGSFVLVNSTEVANEMLAEKARNFPRGGPAWESLSTVFGHGLVGSEGEVWRERRRMIQPHLHQEGMRKLAGGMVAAVDQVCDRWAERTGGGELRVDIDEQINEMTMAVILRIIFGTALGEGDYDRQSENLAFAIDSVALGWLSATLPRWLPLPGRARFRRVIAEIDAMIMSLAEQRRASGRFTEDLLGMLVSLREQGGLDDRGLRDEAVSLFVAGFETTANTLGFTLWELARRPDLRAALREEADRVLGSGPLEFDTIARLHVADLAFREGLRMYPGGLWLPRIALADDTLGGRPIRAGTTVVVSIYNCHRDPRVWRDPHEFRPERHEGSGPERRAFMPFGLGQHMCVGQRVALAEGPLVLARLFQRFEFEPTERAPVMKMSTALKAKDGVWLRMRPRAT